MSPAYELAAGGLVERTVDGGVQIAVVERTRHGGDVTLPKGHLAGEEAWEEGARREIAEEVGWDVRVIEMVQPTAHLVDTVPKLVVWFRCAATGPLGAETDASEVRRMNWLTPEEALARLSYESERRLVASVYGSGAGRSWRWRGRVSRLLNRPTVADRRRLLEHLSAWELELDRRATETPPDDDACDPPRPRWSAAASGMLERAKVHERADDVNAAWLLLHESIRMRIFGVSCTELEAIAESLKHEGRDKLKGWRRDTLIHLLSRPTVSTAAVPRRRDTVWVAERLRDEDAQNTYRKLSSLRVVIRILPWLLALSLGALIFIVSRGILKGTSASVLDDEGQLLLVLALGAVGASLSVLTTVGRGPGAQRVPELLRISSLMLARPLVGAASALVVVLVFQAGLIENAGTRSNAVYAIAVVAGFAERMLTSSVAAVAGDAR